MTPETEPSGAAGSNRELRVDWLQGVPEGLTAYALLPSSGSDRLSKNGRIRLRCADQPSVPTRPTDLLTDSDWNWITEGPRKWPTVVNRLREDAYPIAIALASAGCVTIEHARDGTHLAQPPLWLRPHPDLSGAQSEARDRRRNDAAAIRAHAAALAEALTDEWPDVATALRSTTQADRLAWAVNAAGDLAEGRSHDSVRAFVQVHAGHTKARDDVHHLLAELGFPSEALTALGLARSPYIGLGGPFQVRTPTGTIDIASLPGPHDVRLPSGQDITVRLPSRAPTLLVIENRQASEAGCDAHPELPVIWCHGQPPTAVLDLISQAAGYVNTVLICPDADLGGVRIAARIHDRLKPDHDCTVLDIGTVEHTRGKLFNMHSRTRLTALAQRRDRIGGFAKGCLDRGYAIEQESAARISLRGALAS